MLIKSLYIDLSCTLSLFALPLYPPDNLRSAFQTIFNNKNCYDLTCNREKGYPLLNYDTEKCRITGPSKAPFIKNMGHIGFHTKSAYTMRREDFRECNEEIFGYFSDMKDQRMNFLYFELCPPLKLKVFNSKRKLVAHGKIFIHVFPSGCLCLHLTFSNIDCVNINSREILESIIKQFSPWLNNKELIFYSKLGMLSLSELCKRIYNNIYESIFTQQSKMKLPVSEWVTSSLIISDTNENDIANFLQLGNYYDKTNIFKRKFKIREDFFSNEITTDYIYSNSGKNFYFASIKRDAIIHTFWKFLQLVEFVNYKNDIYKDYTEFFKDSAFRIKDLRLNNENFLAVENILGKNFFKSDILLHMLIMDKMVTTLGPTERALYSFLSQSYGFDKNRDRLLYYEKEWENQVEKWKEKQPALFLLLKLLSSILKIA